MNNSQEMHRMQVRARLTLVGLLILLPWAIFGAQQSVDGMRITPEKWISALHPQRRTFEQFRTEFEGNDVVYVSWPNCTLDDARLFRLEQDLQAANSLPDHPKIVPFERIVTGGSTLEEMTTAPLNLDRDDAVERLKGFLIGPDGSTSCAVVVLTYEGNEYRRESIQHVLKITTRVTDLPEEEIIIAGPPHDGVAIDAESLAGVNVYGTISTFVAGLLCFLCLRSWRIAGLIIGLAGFGQALVLSSFYYSGMTLDAILIVAPPLIFVLTISTGVHFASYFVSQSPDLTTEDAIRAALDEGWTPCWLATITTAVGLFSLSISGIAPVAAFGRMSAICLLVVVTILMFLLPDALRKWPLARSSQNATATTLLTHLAQLIARFPAVITVAFAASIGVAVIGIQGLKTSVDATGMFARDSKILHDYQWIETQIGASMPVEVVIRFNKNSEISLVEQAQTVHRVHAQVARIKGVQGAISACSFLPNQVFSGQTGPLLREILIRKRLHAARSLLDERNYYAENNESQAWRITGRVYATAGTSYRDVLNRIEDGVREFLAENELQATSGVSVQYTGMMPLIESVQKMILKDLLWSLLTAFGLIGISILLVLRRPGLSLMVTVLNTFPVLLVFGVLGMLSLSIDIGTMMTAGVAMGIAVDDTVHFLCHFRQRMNETKSHREAVQHTIQSCGTAMVQTTLICSAAMLVFAISPFVPTRQFGLIMAAILSTALACDLFCLPALLLLTNRNDQRPDTLTQVSGEITLTETEEALP